MNNFDSDVIDLGAASTETHGSAPFGPDDVQIGGKRLSVGIESDD